MPLYEYQCTKCGQKTEQLQRFEDAPLAACPSCGAPVKKLISSPSFQFKGSGWYATDYAKKAGGGADKGDAAAGSSGEGGGGGDTAAGEGSKTGKAKPEGGGESKGGESKGGESKGGEAKGEAKSSTKTEGKPAAGGTGG
jgi:putative FmdB family regulatory protein